MIDLGQKNWLFSPKIFQQAQITVLSDSRLCPFDLLDGLYSSLNPLNVSVGLVWKWNNTLSTQKIVLLQLVLWPQDPELAVFYGGTATLLILILRAWLMFSVNLLLSNEFTKYFPLEIIGFHCCCSELFFLIDNLLRKDAFSILQCGHF